MGRKEDTKKQYKPMTMKVLDQELISDIVQYIQVGIHPETASIACGVSKRNYRKWIARGAQDIEDGVHSVHAEFSFRMEVAEAQAEVLLIAELRKKGHSDWRSDLALLERRFKQRWNKQVEVIQEMTVVSPQLQRQMDQLDAVELFDAYKDILNVPVGEYSQAKEIEHKED